MKEALLANYAIILRSLVSIGVLFLFTIILGKKLVSQLNFFDFITGITIGSIAGVMSTDEAISFTHGLISIIIWGIVPVIASKIALMSIPARRILDGVPTIVIQNGKILEENLKKEKYHVNDLLEELRLKGVFDLSNIENAILETDGNISVQLKSQDQPLTPSNLNIPTTYKGLSANLIIDGKILKEHLRMVNRDENWLRNELKNKNIECLEDVLLASMDSSGNLFIDTKNDQVKSLNILK